MANFQYTFHAQIADVGWVRGPWNLSHLHTKSRPACYIVSLATWSEFETLLSFVFTVHEFDWGFYALHSIILRSFSSFNTGTGSCPAELYLSRDFVFPCYVLRSENFFKKVKVQKIGKSFASNALDSHLGLSWLMRRGILKRVEKESL